MRPPSSRPDALAKLTGYDWPGNVRELRNVLERALAYTPRPRVQEVPGSSDVTWEALERWTSRHLSRPAPKAFVWAWRLVPSSGFGVAESRKPSRLVLAGHHRFARYELAFDVGTDGGHTTLRARTFARFPGVLGFFYRAVVIGSGGHAIVVRRMLRSVAHEASAALR